MQFLKLLVFAYTLVTSILAIAYGAYLVSVVSSQPALLVLAIIFFFLCIAIALFNLVAGYFYSFSQFAPKNDAGALPPKVLPKVALAVTTCNENPALVEKTLFALKKMEYPKEKLEFWVLDNSDAEETRSAIALAAKRNGYRYEYRDRLKGFKAGSINNFISLTRADFLSVFDADERLFDPKLLRDNIGFFYSTPKLAFVQADKKARPAGFLADSIEATYAFFYEHVEPLRSQLGMAMYSGSQGIVSIPILRKLGGFPASPPTPTEDSQFTFVADIAGYRGLFVKKAYSYGEPVENFSTFAKQQWKYSYGLARVLPIYLSNFHKVGNWKKHVHYITQFAGFPYTSLFVILFAFVSAAFVLSDLSFTMVNFSKLFSLTDKPVIDVHVFAPILANIANLIVISRVYFGSFRQGTMTTLLNFALAFKRSEAALAASFKDLTEILVTPKAKAGAKSFLQALRGAGIETAYATFFIALSVFSALRGDFAGSFWMAWYAAMFYLPLAFSYFYK